MVSSQQYFSFTGGSVSLDDTTALVQSAVSIQNDRLPVTIASSGYLWYQHVGTSRYTPTAGRQVSVYYASLLYSGRSNHSKYFS